MAFGDFATLISSFTGANENPISEGGIWTNKIDPASANMQRTSNAARSATSSVAGAWYNVAQFGPDVEAYFTANTKPPNGEYHRLYARLQSPGTAGADGYMVQVAAVSGTDTVALYRMTDVGFTQLGSTYTAEWSAGNKFGIQCIGSSIKVFLDSGSGWTEIISATDANYSTGYVGIGGRTGLLDDFYAGTILTGVKTGSGIAGLTGSGADEVLSVEAGLGVVGAVGSGVKVFIGAVVYIKTGFAIVGADGHGVGERITAANTYTKAGHGVVGTTATSTSGHATNVVFEGVVIAFGSTTLDPYPTWTRIDQ